MGQTKLFKLTADERNAKSKELVELLTARCQLEVEKKEYARDIKGRIGSITERINTLIEDLGGSEQE